MSSSGLNWSSTPLSVDNNDADPWLPIQSKRNQVKQTQQIPNSGRKTIPPPKNKQSDNGIVYGGMVSTNRRTTRPLYVPVPKSAPQIKKKESAIVLKNIGLQARPTAIRALSTTASATSISDSGTALLQTKISNLSKAEKETARSTKDDAGIYDLMMFVKGANGNTKIGSNAVKSVHSRNGKLVIGAQAIAKKPIGVNEEFVKHRFMQGKQKKKAFSKIKKRILMVSNL